MKEFTKEQIKKFAMEYGTEHDQLKLAEAEQILEKYEILYNKIITYIKQEN